DKVSDQYKERLIYELEIIKRMDFVSYFLIVYDYVFYAKKNNIIVGPGRGSAASSLVAYSLGITNIDPLKYGLLFERFLNVERISMPDIDLDFEDHRRDEVKSYIENKYGSSKSASIITFSTLGSKQVIRDLGKIFMVSDELINKLLKEINSKYNLRLNYDNNPHIKDLTTSNDKLKRVYAVGIKLEGLKKLISTHAAGMVISADNLNTLIPMYKTPETYLTGVTMDYLEDYGLLKMDLLALNNLTIIGNCLKLISDLDINNIPLDDKKTFELFASGNTASIFQFESEGMKKFLTKLKPSSFSDLYAAVALYRPGPMGNIDTFIDRKQGRVKIDYLHPNLETILKETYGIIVYQEQIMKILSILAGYSLAESDIVRKGVSKKNLEYLEKEKNRFISGCLKNGYDLKLAEKVFELILKFAAYGFNKAHSVSYALISYQLGYLKANYPNEFYTTLLNMSLGSITKIKELLDNLRAANVKVKDFDLFKSKDIFYIDNGFIYLPLTLIKGIDKNTYEIIMKIISKENNDIYMFMNNAYENNLGKDIIVNLIKMGLLSSFNLNRNTLLTNLDSLLDYAELAHNLDESLVEKPLIEEVPEMEIGELLASEIELCGFYISDHPTNEYFKKGNMKLNEKEKNFDKFVDVVVIVEKIKEIKTKKNEDMAFITASDDTGSMEFILFPNRFNLLNSIHLNRMLIISGKVTRKNDKYGIIINRVKNIGEI
ncbi:MAG: DNA polymerase III subunit alpha, partial [Mollicutes bacterium]|nr:DNA polymerase III subunit alpha [Mollicutes bacterium]